MHELNFLGARELRFLVFPMIKNINKDICVFVLFSSSYRNKLSRTGWLKGHTFISHCWRPGSSRSRWQQFGSWWERALFLACRKLVFSLCPHIRWGSGGREEGERHRERAYRWEHTLVLPSGYKGTDPIRELTPITSPNLKGSPPDTSTLRVKAPPYEWGWRAGRTETFSPNQSGCDWLKKSQRSNEEAWSVTQGLCYWC